MPPAVPTSMNGTTDGCLHCSKSRTLRRAMRTFHMLRRGNTLTA